MVLQSAPAGCINLGKREVGSSSRGGDPLVSARVVSRWFLFLGSAYGFWSYEQELKEGLKSFSLLGIGTVFLVGGS